MYLPIVGSLPFSLRAARIGGMADTQTILDRPPPGGKATVAGFDEDPIRELAAKIAALKPKQADQLSKYLASLGILSTAREVCGPPLPFPYGPLHLQERS